MTRAASVFLALGVAGAVSGCWNSANEFMREPTFSPVGSGLVSGETAAIQSARAMVPQQSWAGPPPSLYTWPRVSHVGDIVTVLISINDKATLDNTSGRTQESKNGLAIDYGFSQGSSSAQPSKITGDLSSN